MAALILDEILAAMLPILLGDQKTVISGTSAALYKLMSPDLFLKVT